MERRLKSGTKTSRFGCSGRVAHDSSEFYKRRLFSELLSAGQGAIPHFSQILNGLEGSLDVEVVFPDSLKNKILCKSAEHMEEIPDNSVHLMVTSPPYNTGKEYDPDLTLTEYREFLKRVWREVFRVLVPGGRACINVANLGRRPYVPLHAYIIADMLEVGFLMRGEIIWVKTGGGSPSTAWGSWMSAVNPTLRDEHEYILVFSKGRFERQKGPKEDTITREEFLTFTKSVWYMRCESAKKIGHPAPFPVELPYRLIQLYTFKGDVILDPFMGSGQTAIASLMCGRYYIGYEIEPSYVELAERRIKAFLQSKTAENQQLLPFPCENNKRRTLKPKNALKAELSREKGRK